MDYPMIFPAITTITLLLLAFMGLKTLIKKPRKIKPKLPPGPWKLPIIGNIHQLVLGSQLPHRLFRDLANKYGPIMHLQLGQVPHVFISSPEAAMEVMKTHDAALAYRPISFASSVLTYNNNDIAFSPYGDCWRQLRKICAIELLTAKRVESFKIIREEEVSNLVRSISSCCNKGLVDLSTMSISMESKIIARTAFGGSFEKKDEFIPLAGRTLEVLTGLSVGELFPSLGFWHVITGEKSKVLKLHQEIDEVLQSVVDEHKAIRARNNGPEEKADNLLDVLLDLQEYGNLEIPLSIESIKGVMLDMFVGGIETSSSAIEWAMSEILRDPTTKQKAQAELRNIFPTKDDIDETKLSELKYLNAIIKETLRLHPPAPLLGPREASKNVNIHGYDLGVKTRVIVNAWAIGRDPKVWNEGERFNPERFLDSPIDYNGKHYEFIPFGSGRRMCPGILFGMSTVGLALANLLYCFNWEVPNGLKPQDLDMSEAFGLGVRRKNRLSLVAIPYCPTPVFQG